MKNGLILATMLGIFALSSCQKEPSSGAKIKDINDLVIPVGFTWENSTDIYFDISVKDTRFADSLHVIAIFDADPGLGGRFLSKGSASISSHFTTKIYLNNTIKEVYIERTAPDNTSTVERVPITGIKISLTMAGGIKDKISGGYKVSGLENSPDCTSGCDATVSSSNSNISVDKNDVVCVTGSNITISASIKRNGVLRICGTNVTVQNLNMESDAGIVVTRTGSVTFSNLNLNSSSNYFTNYGTATISGSFSPSGDVLNESILTINGDYNLNSSSEFENNGTVNVNGTMNVNTSSAVTNNGAITTTSNFQLNNNSNFVNNCSLWVKGNYNNQGRMKNYGLVKVNNTTTINSGDEVSLYSGAMLQTASMMLNGTIKGYGTTSLVKVTGNTTINSSGRVRDALQYCDSNGIETNNGDFTGAAAEACSVYIPITNCNNTGNGTPPIVDTDGDGVNDTLDEYPNDATKAYNNYYPSVSPTAGATVAFEDQWPIKGDYDLNDVVVSYRYKVVTNSQNKVVQLVGDYTLHATGSGYKNGFGVEFPILRSAVSGLTGGTLETGQTNAVVILFTDIRTEMAHWNTEAGETVTTPKNYSITFNITNGPTLNTFGLSSYNPFIWNGSTGKGRTYEIHLPGKTPTSIANKSLFGTGDDNSNVSAARYYVTNNNGLPWAINIPIKPFSYPFERVDISGAYLKFQSWAESGGVQFTDWYSNTGSGYRDPGKIYAP